ncbi:MAG: M56 family metallopeptidase [bacterium]
MNTLFIYLFESATCLAVLYSIYWIFLRRETFFRVNRFYLLAMVCFSIVLPLLPWNLIVSHPSASMTILLEPVIITPAKLETAMQADTNWIGMAAWLYLAGVMFFLVRFALRLFQLHRIAGNSRISERLGRRVVVVDRGYSPFSFFKIIFLNESEILPGMLPAVLDHEQVHIRQKHTLDMILVELASLLQWFNPVIWFTRREIKSIHEYLADEGVLRNGISRSAYQQMILDATMGVRVNSLTNNFNVSLLKKRIAMMTKSKSKTWAKAKVLLALPALVILFTLMTASSYSKSEVLKAVSPGFSPVHLISAAAPVVQDQQKKETQVKYVAPVVRKEVFTVVEEQPTYTGGQDGYVKFLVENIKYPEDAKKKGVTGTVDVSFIIEKDGSVSDVKVLRGIGSGCDQEALRVVKMMPKWNPGKQRGEAVAVQYNLPIKFALDCKKNEEPKK